MAMDKGLMLAVFSMDAYDPEPGGIGLAHITNSAAPVNGFATYADVLANARNTA